MIVWPQGVPYCARVPDGHEGVLLDGRVSFQPDVGPAIMRRRITATIKMWAITLVPLTQDQFQLFEAFVRDDLSGGVLPFVFRAPGSGAVARFQFMASGDPYTHRRATAGREIVSFDLMQLPGALWFAPYVPKGMLRIPDFVADYAADKYWIGQQAVAASDLGQISGTYLVVQQDTSGDQTTSTVSYAGDVPQAAPIGVDWIAGFAA